MIMLRYTILGAVVALALVLLQKQFDYWILSEGGTIILVMGVMIGYAARASYKSGYADAQKENVNS